MDKSLKNEKNAVNFMASLLYQCQSAVMVDHGDHETAEHVYTGTLITGKTTQTKISFDFIEIMEYPTMVRVTLPDGKILTFKREL